MMNAVVFDMDGVIFDSERLVTACWTQVAAKRGIPDMEAACRDCLGIDAPGTKRIMMERYGEDFPYEVFQQEASELFRMQTSGGKLPVKEGVREILPWLHEKGLKVALATSTREEIVRQELKEAGLLSFFDQIICGDMVSNGKPAPDIYLRACEAVGVRPEDAFAVEDSFNGIRAASRAGMHPIMVPDMVMPDEEIRGLACVVLSSLIEARKYIADSLKKENSIGK